MIEKRYTSLFSGIWREIREKIHQQFAEKNAKFELFAIELMKFIISIAKKILAIFDEKIEPRDGFHENGAKECIV